MMYLLLIADFERKSAIQSGITGDHGPSLMSPILSGARNRYMCNVTAEVPCPSYLETAFTFSPGCRQ